MSMRARAYLVAATAMVLGLALVQPAVATPAHDKRSGAKRVILGKSYTSSNATATERSNDPACPWSSTIYRTVWFRYRASRSVAVVARAVPLDRTDIEMAVFRRTSDGLKLVACEDFGWEAEPENVRFHGKRDTVYYFMVGNAAPETPGGRIRFDLHRPVAVSPQLDDVAWARRSNGDAVVTGRVRCSATRRIDLVATLVQTGTSGDGSNEVTCRRDRAVPWIVTVNRLEGDAFHAGPSSLTMRLIYDADRVNVRRSVRTRLVSCSKIGTLDADVISGSKRRDRLCGLYGDDKLVGRGSGDRLFGHAGDDQISGGGGADRLDGGRGNDILNGGSGRDVLLGGNGNDRLLGGTHSDLCRGGSGRDRMSSCNRR